MEAVNNIADYWPLLAEMIATGNAKTKAFEWIWDALPKIKAYIKTPVSMPVADKITNLLVIQDEYEKVENSLHNSGQSFRGQLLAEAISDKGVDNAGKPYPAYTWFQKSINFTSSFNGFGPLCQAAMVLRENVHYVDSAATMANDIYEHSAGYNTMSLLQALHNPSSYVSFAQHLFYGTDERYGAGRPSL